MLNLILLLTLTNCVKISFLEPTSLTSGAATNLIHWVECKLPLSNMHQFFSQELELLTSSKRWVVSVRNTLMLMKCTNYQNSKHKAVWDSYFLLCDNPLSLDFDFLFCTPITQGENIVLILLKDVMYLGVNYVEGEVHAQLCLIWTPRNPSLWVPVPSICLNIICRCQPRIPCICLMSLMSCHFCIASTMPF